MMYYLSLLKIHFSPLNVLTYITFRAGGAILTALVTTWTFGSDFIEFVRSRQLTQVVRQDGPSSHLSKAGTPTGGGILILIVCLTTTLLWARLDNRFVWLCILATLYLGVLGLLDDITKWRKKKGISMVSKMAAQLVLAVALVAYLYIYPPNAQFATRVNVPYFKDLFINFGAMYILFALIVIVGASNAVNLTDGLDGLAIGAIVVSALTLSFFAYLAGHARFSTYLRIIPVAGAGEISVFLASLIGSGLGFLWFNCYPAVIFMGDTGSLFLGGVLGLVAVIIKQELILVVVGGLFVAEAVSVLMQVFSFRHFGKRIFKMAPLHHHFELSGWQEPKVTVRFWILSIVLALIALTSLKLR